MWKDLNAFMVTVRMMVMCPNLLQTLKAFRQEVIHHYIRVGDHGFKSCLHSSSHSKIKYSHELDPAKGKIGSIHEGIIKIIANCFRLINMPDHNQAGTLHSSWNFTSKWIYFKWLNSPSIIVQAFGISDNLSVTVDKNETPAAKSQDS